jgi:uncharacterized membrane protein YccC
MKRIAAVNLFGVHLAVNLFIGTTVLWVMIRGHAEIQPIWAISSMIAASEPRVEDALKFFRGRLVNALIGCATGLFILFVGGTSEWKIPLALSVSVLISTYLVRVAVMWRQAPITATIVVASGLTQTSKLIGLHQGLLRVGEVLLGCVVGLLVTFVMSRVWPLPRVEPEGKPQIA